MEPSGRAVVFRGVGQPLELKEYPRPEPGPGAALVRITEEGIQMVASAAVP